MNINELTIILAECNTEEAIEFSKDYLRKIVDDVTVFSGGVLARYEGGGDSTVLIDAHIDEIGFTVTGIDEKGFLKFSNIGGVDRRVLEDACVTVVADSGEKITGIVSTTPPHLQKNDSEKAFDIYQLAIDIGFNKEQAESKISLGNKIYFKNSPISLNDNTITSKALDNRCGCAAVINAFERLVHEKVSCNVVLLLSELEEVNAAGATVGAFRAKADEALIVDVSFGEYPGAENKDTGKMGGGAMIGVSPVLDKELSTALKKTAVETNLPFQTEIIPGKTGTNADVISITSCGVKSCTISIPIRNMHTPVETVVVDDIQCVSDLIFHYINRKVAL